MISGQAICFFVYFNVVHKKLSRWFLSKWPWMTFNRYAGYTYITCFSGTTPTTVPILPSLRVLCCGHTQYGTDWLQKGLLTERWSVSSEKCFSKRRAIDADFMHPFLIRSRRSAVRRSGWLILALIDLRRLDWARAVSLGRGCSLWLSSAKTASCLSSQFVIARPNTIRDSSVIELIQVRGACHFVLWRVVDIRWQCLLSCTTGQTVKIN